MTTKVKEVRPSIHADTDTDDDDDDDGRSSSWRWWLFVVLEYRKLFNEIFVYSSWVAKVSEEGGNRRGTRGGGGVVVGFFNCKFNCDNFITQPKSVIIYKLSKVKHHNICDRGERD